MRILIVEDDENIAKYIQTCLSLGGYQSDICDNGQTSVEVISNRRYDLVLLDIMLPGLDGFEVLERIKAYGIPTIFLTAMQEITDKVQGLKAGAEDYIVKPFEALELLARVEVALRRNPKHSCAVLYDHIEMDLEKHTVKKDGSDVALTPKEFDVLAFFLQHQDMVVSREKLLSMIWGYTFQGETRTVDTHVQQVRKKLGLQGALIAVPKYGYKLLKRM